MIDIEKIKQEVLGIEPDKAQVALQGIGDGNTDYGTGRLVNLNHAEQDLVVPNYDLPYTNAVMDTLGMYRTRMMRMKPKSCYTYHQDPTKRIHIPLITNESCFMVIEDKCYWYPADGNYYIADTTKLHTFVNASKEERVHIIGCID